jgi:hypothetical protein
VPRPKAQPPSWQREKLTECLNLYTSPSPAVYDMGTLRTEQCLPSLADPKSIFWRIPFFSNATEVPRPKAQPPSWQREKLTECYETSILAQALLYMIWVPYVLSNAFQVWRPIFWRIPFFSNATEVPRPKAQPPSWQREKLTECTKPLLYMIWVPYVLSNAFQVWRIQNQFSGGYPFLAMPRRCPGQRHSLLAGKGKN